MPVVSLNNVLSAEDAEIKVTILPLESSVIGEQT